MDRATLTRLHEPTQFGSIDRASLPLSLFCMSLLLPCLHHIQP